MFCRSSCRSSTTRAAFAWYESAVTDMSTRRELGLKYLAEVDRHIKDATRRITSLRGYIADLERDGHDAGALRDALVALEATLQRMANHRAIIVLTLDSL